MQPVESRITSKGQVSIPAAVRRRLDVTPGARVEWLERDGEVVIRRASRFSSADIHAAVFAVPPNAASVVDMDAGIRAHLKKKHARR
jgi:AbrB family looped-hinge helix DNA binding protein